MPETMFPRRLYFGGEDRPAANMPGPTREAKEGNHAIETGTRHKLADRLIKSAEAVAAGVRVVRAFDTTGHTRESLPHLAAVVDDMKLAYAAFLASVTKAFDRHELRTRDNRRADVDPAKVAAYLEADLISATEAEQLLATAAPKPAPRKLQDVPQA